MKARSLKILLAAIFLTCIMMVGNSFAAFVTARVGTASTTDGAVQLKLSFVSTSGTHTPVCTSFPANPIWFLPATANMDDQTLAVALTAMSLGQNIRITVTHCPADANDRGEFSTIGLIMP